MATKLTSRKFWLAIVGAVCALFLAITGQLEWSLAIKIVTGVLATYIGIEGLADALGRLK
jgi:type IV secretory pathway VirB2 component (pilin)